MYTQWTPQHIHSICRRLWQHLRFLPKNLATRYLTHCKYIALEHFSLDSEKNPQHIQWIQVYLHNIYCRFRVMQIVGAAENFLMFSLGKNFPLSWIDENLPYVFIGEKYFSILDRENFSLGFPWEKFFILNRGTFSLCFPWEKMFL